MPELATDAKTLAGCAEPQQYQIFMERLCKCLALVFSVCLLLTGCPKDPQVDPQDTVTDGPLGTGEDDDWFVDQNIDRPTVPTRPSPGDARPADLPPMGPTDGELVERGADGGVSIFQGNDGIGGSSDAMMSIYFGFDEYNIRASERAKLDTLANQMRQNPGLRVVAEGHTSWRGTEDYNLGLSERRAGEVRRYLDQIGIDPRRVQTRPLGELEATLNVPKSSPEAENDRRVDIISQ